MGYLPIAKFSSEK